MQVAIISDIHGNAVALDTVLEDIEQVDPDKIVCLGDVAATGPEPIRAIERIQALGCPVINGNADEDWLLEKEHPEEDSDEDDSQMVFEVRDWTAAQLSPEHKRFIESFEDTVEIDLTDNARLLCYHGTPESPWDIINEQTSVEELDEYIDSTAAEILIGGHNHNQLVRRYRDATFVNAGSVGLAFGTPREHREHNWPWGEWALVTASNDSVSIDLRRTALDLDDMFVAARDSELPNSEEWIGWWRKT